MERVLGVNAVVSTFIHSEQQLSLCIIACNALFELDPEKKFSMKS